VTVDSEAGYWLVHSVTVGAEVGFNAQSNARVSPMCAIVSVYG